MLQAKCNGSNLGKDFWNFDLTSGNKQKIFKRTNLLETNIFQTTISLIATSKKKENKFLNNAALTLICVIHF